MLTKYQLSIDKIFFKSTSEDALYKSEVKPYIKDKFRFERALKILNSPSNKTIFEIGPYPGTGIFYFGETNQIVGFGNSDERFEQQVNNSGHKLIELDLESSFALENFDQTDIVLLMEVLEHIRQPYKFIENVSRLLKPGGHLYLTTNNQFYIGYILKLLLQKNIFDPISTEGSFYPGHCRYYDIKELKKIFQDLGLIVVEANYINFLPSHRLYKNQLFGFFKNFLLRIFPKGYSTHVEFLLTKPNE